MPLTAGNALNRNFPKSTEMALVKIKLLYRIHVRLPSDINAPIKQTHHNTPVYIPRY